MGRVGVMWSWKRVGGLCAIAGVGHVQGEGSVLSGVKALYFVF